jgi:DNA mismatch repair protein MutS
MQNSQEATQSYPPMLLQYLEYKKKHPDCLILFQVGDFYELFFDDARTVAKTLNLTLTSRDKSSPNPIPMCGVPVSVVDGYVERLVDAGFSAALITQAVGEAQGKGMVSRYLERIVTPGIRILGSATKDSYPCFVAALFMNTASHGAFAWCDIQGGQVAVEEDLSLAEITAAISRISPRELVICSNAGDGTIDRRLSWVREVERQIESGLKFRPASNSETERFDLIPGLAPLRGSGKRAVRLLCSYVDETTVNVAASIVAVGVHNAGDVVAIDTTTRRNLELLKAGRDGTSKGSLFSVVNKTFTQGGSKLLARWIVAPSTSKETITERLGAVRAFYLDNARRSALQKILSNITDIERIGARLALGVVTPKELAALRDTLVMLPEIQKILKEVESKDQTLIAKKINQLSFDPSITASLERFLSEDPPFILSEGGIVRPGFDAEVDRLRSLRAAGSSWISELELQERQRSGINSLKIKFNQVLGYFIEVTAVNAGKVPSDYIKRQSTSNAERFVIDSLRIRAAEITSAFDKQVARERLLFEAFRETFKSAHQELRIVAQSLSEIDVLISYAEVAHLEGYTEPLIEASTRLIIKDGRHPVLNNIKRHDVTANSISLNSAGDNSILLTGPNMGGKSTFLRQNALIAILAQSGSFVPAKEATIGIVDKIFARIGASDDLLEGDSTFMVEMREASHIIREATLRSLVLIDELGRGTATSDGLSLARAILEWLVVSVKCRTLFATHFHELTQIVLPGLNNFSVAAVETDSEVIFTHEIRKGPASRSYGLEVAALAGVPDAILERARGLLTEPQLQEAAQLPLFTKPVDTARKELDMLKKEIKSLEVNSLTPLQALQFLSDLQKKS